jgi:hypothetical protein
MGDDADELLQDIISSFIERQHAIGLACQLILN